jgi:hypothetical protein
MEIDETQDGRITDVHDDPTMIVRHFSAEAESEATAARSTCGSSRTGEKATVADGFGGVARGVPYEEEWMPGVFDHQLNAATTSSGTSSTRPAISGIVAKGLALRPAPTASTGRSRR